jgi:phosphopantothenoylcysteine decarboxylase/phosphopantothenate--cysteine ligase
MKVLVSAGPTREFIDSVRFITNASSGRMGLAVAKAAVEAGHKVTVVLGQVGFKPRIKGVRFVHVVSAREMLKAVLRELGRGFDVFFSAAAVGDYTPVRVHEGKLSSKGGLVLKLKPTEKITMLVKLNYPRVFVVAFKAEYNVSRKTLFERAFSKLRGEGLDAIVANDIGRHRMGSNETGVYLIDRSGKAVFFSGSKVAVARKLFRSIVPLPASTGFC